MHGNAVPAASTRDLGSGRRSPFLRDPVDGTDRGAGDRGPPAARLGFEDPDLVDPGDALRRAVLHLLDESVVGGRGVPAGASRTDRVAGRAGDGDDLRDGLGSEPRGGVGAGRPGIDDDDRCPGPAGRARLELDVPVRRRGIVGARMDTVAAPGARDERLDPPDGHRDRERVPVAGGRAGREGTSSCAHRATRTTVPCARTELARSRLRRRSRQRGDLRESVVRGGARLRTG